MAYFLNLFPVDYYNVFLVSSSSSSVNFKCLGNSGRGPEHVVSYGTAPYDLSTNDADSNARRYLKIQFTLLPDTRRWSAISVDLGTGAATTAASIVSTLNAAATFSAWFTASLNQSGQILITSNLPQDRFRFYIEKTNAEEVLKFNKFAGVAELPLYFDRDTIANRYTFDNSQNILIKLDPNAAGGASVIDDNIINNAVDRHGVSLGFSSATVQEDWQLLAGRTSQFIFTKQILDSAGNVAQKIEYHAGAGVGDLAKKTCYFRNGGAINDLPYAITEVPHVLESGDLVTPDCSEATDYQT